MQRVHAKFHQLRSTPSTAKQDVIVLIAEELASECTILCFDEFQVTDIADAMILR